MPEIDGDGPGLSLERPATGADSQFGLILEALPNGVLVVGDDGTIALVNRLLAQQFGYTREELIGQSVDILLPEGLRAALTTLRKSFTTAPESRPMGADRELSGRRKDGSQITIEIGLSHIAIGNGVFVLASVVDSGERRRLEKEHHRAVEEAVRFDRLAGDLAAAFVNLPAEEVDDAIQDAQRRVLEALDLDRSAIFQVSGGDGDFVLTHHYARPALMPPPPRLSASSHPWSLTRILNGETACFSSVDEIPDAVERETVRRHGTEARAACPLSIDGRIAGAISFASRKVRSWLPETLSRLRLVAQVFGSALARRQADAALQTSEQRFHTLADNAPPMIWVSGPDKRCTWFNRQWLEFVGQSLEHALGNGWAENLHPDDLGSWLQIYQKSFDARQPFSMEYRFRRHDGEWRWILDKGAPNYGTDGTFAGYLGSCIDITELREATREVERLRDQLHVENVYLRREVKERLGTNVIVGQSAAVRRVLEQAQQVATTDSTVLLLGETGTGKELFATQIHELSGRRGRPMVRVNCGAIPATLIESELFGREKGAFTGALARQLGRFELADHSTIFLDEIGDLPTDIQLKLLRVLEERQIERLGSPKGILVNVRIIAATHRNLEQRIAEGAFREDLFYRLNVFPIDVPPLRERVEDIPLLVWRFVEEFSKTFGKRIDAISRDCMAELQRYAWPGNIRELRNTVERAMIVATGPRLTITVPTATPTVTKRSVKLTDVEKEHIRSVLEGTNWRIRGAGGAADRLGLRPTTLETRMAKLGLFRPKR